jgi:hypothetical protein
MATRGWGRTQVSVKPEGQIRQSQIVTTFGPGAMVDLVDQAVLVGGLDFWSYGPGNKAATIQEPRLRDALAERFRLAGRELSVEYAFREPPVADDKNRSRSTGITVLEFPQWFVCQGPECRALLQPSGLERKGGRYFHQCSRTRTVECVPVRFVAACRRGHIEEFPWIAFVHEMRERKRCAAPSLRLLEGATGDFSEVEVRCACGERERLSAATVPDVNPRCRGTRPWLGPEGREECDEHVRMMVRTASNSYFAQVVSALSVPEKGRELEEAIRRVWDVMQAVSSETLGGFRSIPKVKGALAGYADDEVLATVAAIREGKPVAQEPLRTAEFRQFIGQKVEGPGELPGPNDLFFARRWVPKEKGEVPANVEAVVLAHKLREVRVQVGFTRIEPVTPDLQGEFDLGVQSAALGLTANWLPASEVRGEGVFVQLDEDAVRAWENRAAVLVRGRELLAGYDAWAKTSRDPPPFPGVRFYMLHSLAHLLTSAISLECGYAASAIRERIYCAAADADVPMAAILLSTGSTGTEGTLGGLVGQGRHLGGHLRHAFDLGVLCSYDPVCASHSPADDPAERHLEGAACHGCLFIAECSCERFNRYLDRALVVPTIGHDQALAFFSERP